MVISQKIFQKSSVIQLQQDSEALEVKVNLVGAEKNDNCNDHTDS